MTQEDPKQKILTLELSVEEINTVLSGLQELPAKTCNPLTNKIVKQAQQQLPKEESEPQ
jgi:hypothetical protein